MSATVAENTITAANWMVMAADCGADLAVFPEMMLTGYDQHLHEYFSMTGWYTKVQDALRELTRVASETGISAVVGSPYVTANGYLNALVLVQPESEPTLAGARTFIVEGWKTLWGFTEAQDRSPIEIGGISFGSVFCAEASFLDRVPGRGLETSEIILWPGVATRTIDEHGGIVRDGCAKGAEAICQLFGVPVIQSSYISQVTQLPKDRILGGSVVCDALGNVISRASTTDGCMLLCDIERDGDAAFVRSIDTKENGTPPSPANRLAGTAS